MSNESNELDNLKLLNMEKSINLMVSFLKYHNLYDFLSTNENIYIGGSLPSICFGLSSIDTLDVGDID